MTNQDKLLEDKLKLITSTLILDTKGIVNKYHNPEIAPKEMNDELDSAYHKANQAILQLIDQHEKEARRDALELVLGDNKYSYHLIEQYLKELAAKKKKEPRANR